MCEIYGNKCFKDLIDSRYEKLEETCLTKCLPDCEIAEFQLKREEKTTRQRQFCNDLMTAGTPEDRKIICGYFEDKFDVEDAVMKAVSSTTEE